ncbi:MAG TPA: 2,3-bisphosphoglycerate-independent phosphoglycerate mutase [Anaerolineales bacterium]|nr:2,3-bisphosphoglycerate-independent phosphoglycerate mutase [Anaerolineales bacterium]
MPYDYLPPLLIPNPSKIVLLILDGLGGLPMSGGGLTELESARTPNLDRLAAEGCLGASIPVRMGITPGSGPAHLALFGYDPIHYDIGRGVLEAVGVGIDVHAGDVAARGNFCTLDPDGLIVDRRAGRITSDAAGPAIAMLQSIRLEGVTLEVQQVKEYRFAVVMRGEGLHPALNDTDPQVIGKAPLRVQAENEASLRAATLFNTFIDRAQDLLADQPQANGITLRGFSTEPGLPNYLDSYGLRAACVAVYPMYKGVSKLVGMDVIGFTGENPADEFAAVAGAWDRYDFFFVHIKKTDSMGEDGNFDGKVAVIETVDQALPALLDLAPDVLIVTGDHSTPAKLRYHSWHPVPYLLWAPETHLRDQETAFGERACARGGLGTFLAQESMKLALAHARRLIKYGA